MKGDNHTIMLGLANRSPCPDWSGPPLLNSILDLESFLESLSFLWLNKTINVFAHALSQWAVKDRVSGFWELRKI